MTASIRILTTTSIDSNPSLLLISPDGSKTIINCGEGSQRSLLEMPGTIRVSSVNRICLTHVGHDTLGGLPGMILTSADVVNNVAKEMMQKNHVVNNKKKDTTTAKMNDNNNRKRNFNGSLISNNNEEESDIPADLEIVGPNGIKTFLHSLRHFMRRDRFKVNAHEGYYDSSALQNAVSTNQQKKSRTKKKRKQSNEEQTFGFAVKSIPISYNSYAQYPQHYDTTSIIQDQSSQPPSITKQAISYLFTTPPLPGKFLINKAIELNIPRGPLYAQLKKGEDVTFLDSKTNEERTVKSEEVVEQSRPGVCVAVIYCPTLDVLDKLVVDESLVALEKNNTNMQDETAGVELDVMVHFTPKHIFNHPKYQSWCKRFDKSTTEKIDHITLHSIDTLEERSSVDDEKDMNGNSPYVSGICGGMRRSFVNDELYPMPCPTLPDDKGQEKVVTEEDKVVTEEDGISIIKANVMMDYILMPRSRRGLDESTVKPLYTEKLMTKLQKQVKESGAIDRASSIMKSINDKEKKGPTRIMVPGQKNISSSSTSNANLGELIFTGTGSAVPCKHRNVTGKYLRMNNGNSILLDVGEGTVGQLLRSWKSTISSNQTAIDEYKSRLKGIKAVWISHPHADHHLGLLRLLSERAAICCGQNDPIVLMAPHDMYDFLQEYQTVLPEIKSTYIFVECYDMIHGRVNPLGRKLYDELGITNCISIPVAHCQRSYAVVIDGTPFGKVSYSGDCRPSNRFANVGYGTDLLIHEATFEDGMEEDAVLKRHSTVGEAMDVASKMNAKALILTHFSQRYPKIPPLNNKKAKQEESNDGMKKKDMPIVFAFDFMKLTPNTVDLASELTPALRLLYSETDEEDDEAGSEEKVSSKELMAVPGLFAAKGAL